MASLAHLHHLHEVLKLIFIFFFLDDGKFHFFHLLTRVRVLFDKIMDYWLGIVDITARRVTSAWAFLDWDCIVGVERGL
jgi:hypothetical protein